EGGARLVDVAALIRNILHQVEVLVPTAVENLDATNSPLDHPTREQATRGEGAWLVDIRPIEILHMLGLLVQIDEVRHRLLHAEGHLVLGDARIRLRVAEFLEGPLIELVHYVEHPATRGPIHSRGIGEIEDRIARAA